MTRLTDLPLEVRHIIFGYFLSTRQQIWLRDFGHPLPDGGLSSSLFHINRQLRREALAFFFNGNQISYGNDRISFSRSWMSVPNLPLSPWDTYVVHLHVKIGFVTRLGEQTAGRKRFKSYCRSIIRSFRSLETLVFYVLPGSKGPSDAEDEEFLKNFLGAERIADDTSRRVNNKYLGFRPESMHGMFVKYV
ncbi:MAG: hypothetical protein M1821_002235 [Bathelium mastoideum]|nr:MAG: hypothetical protein M1821_002235 [Bathelium mastoideum]